MPYPYLSENTCRNCEEPIIVKQKRDRYNHFCCKECYNIYRRNGEIRIALGSHCICLRCKKKFIPTRNTKGMYCSYACSNGSKSVRHQLKCECCSKEFEINNIAEIKRGHYKYCSNECRKRRYKINERFFDVIDANSAYWLGFIWAVIKDNKYNSITILSKKDLLERFNQAFGSNYPIRKTRNKFLIKIISLTLLSKLVELGINNALYLEFPDIDTQFNIDFIRGYFDSDWGYHYKDRGKDVAVLHGKSSKLMKFISEIINSKLIMDKGEWVSISFDFNKIDGTPRLDSKWLKFN